MKEKEDERPGDRLLAVQSLLEKWNDAGQSRRIVAIWEFYPFNKERREKWRRDHRNVASKQILLITLILRATFVIACIDAAQIREILLRNLIECADHKAKVFFYLSHQEMDVFFNVIYVGLIETKMLLITAWYLAIVNSIRYRYLTERYTHIYKYFYLTFNHNKWYELYNPMNYKIIQNL